MQLAVSREPPHCSKSHFHHGTNLDRATTLQHRAAGRKLHRVLEVARFDDDEAEDEILGFGEWSVGDHPRLANDLARSIEWLPGVLQMTLGLELANPGQPALH